MRLKLVGNGKSFKELMGDYVGLGSVRSEVWRVKNTVAMEETVRK